MDDSSLLKSSPCIVRCGLLNDPTHQINDETFFWPVAQAVPLQVSLDKSFFNHPFSLIFTSKPSVHFFSENIFRQYGVDFKQCVGVYCVGFKTKEYFTTIFSSQNNIPCTFFSKKMGIQNLIEECRLTNKTETLLFFTALIGKTKDVVREASLKASTQIVPLYDLIPYKSDFLKNLFSQNPNGVRNTVFKCYSGRILETAATFLMNYFDCRDIHDLPKFIKLLPVGTSALEKEKLTFFL